MLYLTRRSSKKHETRCETSASPSLYVDVESIIRQFRVAASAAGAAEALAQVEDRLPEVLGVSSSFVDNGLRIDGYYQTPPGSTIVPSANSLGSAALLPDDSLALISVTGLKEALDEALTELEEDTTLGFRHPG